MNICEHSIESPKCRPSFSIQYKLKLHKTLSYCDCHLIASLLSTWSDERLVMTTTRYYHDETDIVGSSPACRCPWEDRPCVSGCGAVWLADTSQSLGLYLYGWRRDLRGRLSLLYKHMEKYEALSVTYSFLKGLWYPRARLASSNYTSYSRKTSCLSERKQIWSLILKHLRLKNSSVFGKNMYRCTDNHPQTSITSKVLSKWSICFFSLQVSLLKPLSMPSRIQDCF